MISRLAGRLAGRSPEEVVVDVGGVGYQVFVSLQTYTELPPEGSPIELLTYTHVREDALQLYGFRDFGERALFLLLKEVSGIGPRLALNILSGMPAASLRQALRDGDLARLVAIPGVGKKTAERMILELREKVARIAEEPARRDGVTGVAENAVSALVNLGYRRPEAERSVENAVRAGRATFEDVVREALKGLAR
ncbi:MAG: Holliday junction branch migration protein RuvA [Candidatus Binatia bacterium]